MKIHYSLETENTGTAIILRPAHMPEIHVLECDGPLGITKVHRYPGDFLGPYLSFESWVNLPEHAKSPRPVISDYDQARRCARLLRHAEATGTLPARHLREILTRLETIHGPLEP